MNHEDALRKIRALLKTSGRSEHEATTAQILAAALAEKHGIDLEEAAADRPESTPITHKIVGEWASLPPEAANAALIVDDYFDVSTLHVSSYFATQIVIVGTAHHIEIAEYVFTFLKREFARRWNTRKCRSRKRSAFIWGCAIAVMQKLQAGRLAKSTSTSTTALVVSLKARRDKYVADTWGKTTSKDVSPKTKRGTATSKGYRAGLGIDVRPGMAGGPAPAGQLSRPSLALPAPR